jgi:O-antigen/teichoic acid export membrane protein
MHRLFKSAEVRWFALSRFASLILNSLIAILAAREFGSEQYGKLGFALNLVILFAILATMGNDGYVLRKLFDSKINSDELLATALVIRLCGGFLLMGITLSLTLLIAPKDSIILVLTSVFAFSTFLQIFSIFELWFQSRAMTIRVNRMKLTLIVLSFIVKTFFVVLFPNLIFFSATFVLENFVLSALLVYNYVKASKSLSNFRFSSPICRDSLTRSWPMILAGFFVTVSIRIEVVLLGYYIDIGSTIGHYSIALTMAAVWQFIPVAIVSARIPAIIAIEDSLEVTKHHEFRQFQKAVVYVSLVISGLIFVFCEVLISVLLGPEFKETENLVRILLLASVVSMISLTRSQIIVKQKLEKFYLVFTFLGALVNLLLCVILIPKIGALGASIAHVSAQIASVLLAPLLFNKTRFLTKDLILVFRFSR